MFQCSCFFSFSGEAEVGQAAAIICTFAYNLWLCLKFTKFMLQQHLASNEYAELDVSLWADGCGQFAPHFVCQVRIL